jgi:hypothetical protein
MSGRAFLLPLARLLMSSLFIWTGSSSCAIPAARYNISPAFTSPRPVSPSASLYSCICSAAWRCLRVSTPDGPLLFLFLICLGTAFGVHLPAGDQGNMIHFYQNLAMTGGFLYVIAFGPGGLSLDRPAA